MGFFAFKVNHLYLYLIAFYLYVMLKITIQRKRFVNLNLFFDLGASVI
jgi:hypothetical protein